MGMEKLAVGNKAIRRALPVLLKLLEDNRPLSSKLHLGADAWTDAIAKLKPVDPKTGKMTDIRRALSTSATRLTPYEEHHLLSPTALWRAFRDKKGLGDVDRAVIYTKGQERTSALGRLLVRLAMTGGFKVDRSMLGSFGTLASGGPSKAIANLPRFVRNQKLDRGQYVNIPLISSMFRNVKTSAPGIADAYASQQVSLMRAFERKFGLASGEAKGIDSPGIVGEYGLGKNKDVIIGPHLMDESDSLARAYRKGHLSREDLAKKNMHLYTPSTWPEGAGLKNLAGNRTDPLYETALSPGEVANLAPKRLWLARSINGASPIGESVDPYTVAEETSGKALLFKGIPLTARADSTISGHDARILSLTQRADAESGMNEAVAALRKSDSDALWFTPNIQTAAGYAAKENPNRVSLTLLRREDMPGLRAHVGPGSLLAKNRFVPYVTPGRKKNILWDSIDGRPTYDLLRLLELDTNIKQLEGTGLRV